MSVVYKYPLLPDRDQLLTLPSNAIPLSVHLQKGIPTMWVLQSPSVKSKQVKVRILATGEETEETGRFLGTLVDVNGWMVLHVFVG